MVDDLFSDHSPFADDTSFITTLQGGLLAQWLRHWTLNHEIVGSSPAVRLVFSTKSPWARFVPEMGSGSLSRKMRTWEYTEKAIVH